MKSNTLAPSPLATPRIGHNGFAVLIGDALTPREAIATQMHRDGCGDVHLRTGSDALAFIAHQKPSLVIMEASLAEGMAFMRTLRRHRHGAWMPAILVMTTPRRDKMTWFFNTGSNWLAIERYDQKKIEQAMAAILSGNTRRRAYPQMIGARDAHASPGVVTANHGAGFSMPRGPPEIFLS